MADKQPRGPVVGFEAYDPEDPEHVAVVTDEGARIRLRVSSDPGAPGQSVELARRDAASLARWILNTVHGDNWSAR